MYLNQYDELEGKLSGVLDTLESILREKLDNFGIYYRMFSRIKSGSSINAKLSADRYQKNPQKKIKDLFGIRIMLYYQDDIEVCKKILEDMLINTRWKKSQSDASTFDATKNNGTFLLPGFVQKVVLPEIAELRIEPTFEIQLRTVFFEGWHETEHDMRYKEQQIWDQMPKESRRLNSVLATLEMCDSYMVSLFDDVGHDFYKEGNYGQMIRYKYRLRTLNGDLDPGIEKAITPKMAKKIFKLDKTDFIDMVLSSGFNRLDANIIVYLVNEKLKKTPEYRQEIYDEFQNLRKQPNKKVATADEKNYVLTTREKAFGVRVVLDCEDGKDAVFERLLSVVYDNWLKTDLEELFPEELNQPVHPINAKKPGVSFKLKYAQENHWLRASIAHVGTDEPGKFWTVIVELSDDPQKGLVLECYNYFDKAVGSSAEVLAYNRPRVYKELSKLGMWDVRKLERDFIDLNQVELEEFFAFLENEERTLPVLVITVPTEEEKNQLDSCFGRMVDYAKNPRFPGQNNLMRIVGYVCHVYYATDKAAVALALKLGEKQMEYQNGIRFFAKGFQFEDKKGYTSFNEKEIFEKPKDIFAIRTKKPYFYQTVAGPDAVRHEIIQMVHRHMLES